MNERFLRSWSVLCLLATASLAAGQDRSPDGSFELIKEIPAAVAAGRSNVRPDAGQPVRVDWAVMRAALAQAPLEGTPGAAKPLVLALPMPDGTWARFGVVDSPVMEPGLAAAFPDIRTFAGQGLDDPASTVRLDYTPHGFHAQVYTVDGSWYVDPYTFGETTIVTSYWKRDLRPQPGNWVCETRDDGLPAGAPGYGERAIVTLRTYTLAVGATGQYTAFHGGTQALGLAAITTAVNRLNQMYERDLAVRFVLAANNINIVYTNANTDPYQNNGSTADLTANQTTCDSVIGTANYDVGHLFCTGTGGVATLNSVCTSSKARGLSGQPSPINDPFVIDYVAHELGHQFGGRHCFNNCGGTAGDSQVYAYEPGSGATIMAYAGICGAATDLQPNSDAMFHSGSLDLMSAFIATTSCDTETNSGNNTPTVSAGSNYTIPKQTPFTLTATGSDVDGDAVTYSWEQRNTASGVVAVNTDNGTNPIQRTWLPSASPSRTIPRLSNLLNNTTAFGEILPQVARTLSYRVVARDNRSGSGGTAVSNITLTVNGTAGPFTVTSPNTAVAWSGVRTVTWNVASTNVAPVNCANVKISLSTDGGNTFPTVLLASTPNDGSENVTLPNVTTSAARIKVEAVGNIFFDLSNVNFSITPATGVAFGGTGLNSPSDAAPNGNANGVVEPGESSLTLTVQMLNSGAQTATNVVGTLSSLTPTVNIISGVSAYPNMAPGVPQMNTVPFVFAVSPSHVCGDAISLRLNISSTQGSGVYDFTLPTGTPGGTNTLTFSYTGPAVAIPDNNGAGANAALVVSGFTGTVADLDFRFDGTTCSSAPGSTTVGLDHTYVGDLIVRLTAPGGASCIMIDRMGGGGTDTNNFCQTVLDDEAGTPIEGAAAASAPFSGSWAPNNPLAVFDGINPNGTWTLNVSDVAAVDIGSIRRFSLIISRQLAPTCQPPLPPACDPDVNCDGAVNGFDIQATEEAVNGDFSNFCQSSADLNGDGSENGFDIETEEQRVNGAPC
ncbi:Calcium-dependent protease [Phycisphaerales bacterium]|nr:Calcium-dependent protease [Phycisphaerales bacterium]